VCPKSAAFLHEANRAGCSWPEIDGEVPTKVDNLIMGARQRHVQETLWIKQGQRGRHEKIPHNLEAGLGCAGAVRMTTHAIEDEHQCRLFGNNNSGAILVIFTITECGDFGVFDIHSFRVALIGLQQRPQLRMALLTKT
jgi:hypothetical protein